MTDYGVTADGFVIKPYNVIVDEMKIQAAAQFGSDIDLSESSPLLKFIETVALQIYEVWEMGEALYHSGFIDTASDESLDRVVKLLGVIRQPAVKATGIVRFSGTNGTIVPIGIRVSTGAGIIFVTTASGTVAAGTVSLAVECQTYGVAGNVGIGTIITMVDNVTGIVTITNLAATSGGEEIETDSALRYRASLALEQVGKATVAAIEAAVLAVPGVTNVIINENTTTHSFEAVVEGLTYPNALVYAAIDETRAAGIAFTWKNPTGVDIWVDTTVACTNEPADAVNLIKAKILSYISGLNIGDDVIYSKMFDVIFNEYDWVDDVTLLKTGIASPPLGVINIVIAADARAQSALAKIGVTIT